MAAPRIFSAAALRRPFASSSFSYGCRRSASANSEIHRENENDPGDIEPSSRGIASGQRNKPKKLRLPQSCDFRSISPKPVLLSKEDELFIGPARPKKLRITRIPAWRDRRGKLPPIPDHILSKANNRNNIAKLKAILSKRKGSSECNNSDAVSEDLTNVLDRYEMVKDGRRRTRF